MQNPQLDPSTLFTELKDSIAILLIDASGSVNNQIKPNQTVFDKIIEVVSQLPHETYYIMFWNSPQPTRDKFKTGFYCWPYTVSKKLLTGPFLSIKSEIAGNCLTYSNIPFENIPADWLKRNAPIYFVTDGEIGYRDIKPHELSDIKNKLCRALRALHEHRINIITVENVERDYTELEALNNAAGCDVYNLIMQNKLTDVINRFVSHTNSKEFIHVNKIKPPAGHIPYESRFFPESKTDEFINFIRTELKSSDEEQQLRIAHNLATTLKYLIKDKNPNIARNIVRMFSAMFTIDRSMINALMVDSINKEIEGSAMIYTDYRNKLKNLFKQADIMISRNVRDSIGVGQQFMSCVVNDRILVGPNRLMIGSAHINSKEYPYAALDRTQVPVFPLLDEEQKLSPMEEQCIRQWIRIVYGAQYSTHNTSDEIIYLVLGVNVIVSKSNLPVHIRTAYRLLARVMLNKKRLNTQETEYEYLIKGKPPVPNSGKITDLTNYLKSVCRKLSITANPMRLWGEMCRSISDELYQRQTPHCITDPDYLNEIFITPEYKLDSIPELHGYEYKCLITLDDISHVGGYRFAEHRSGNQACAPIYLISEEGRNKLINQGNIICPVCYTRLTREQLLVCEPMPQFELPEIYAKFKLRNEQFSHSDQPASQPASQAVVHQTTYQLANQSNGSINNQKRIVVILKGTVGAGKTTYAAKLKALVEQMGGVCCVEGMDKYSVRNMQGKIAIQIICQNFQTLSQSKNSLLVAIVDTCGEGNNGSRIFNFDFTNWQRVVVWPNFNSSDVDGYLAWSLQNVLSRADSDQNSTYNLNPVRAGVDVCRSVHKKKAQALGLKYDESRFMGEAIERYQSWLAAQKDIELPF